MPKILDPTGFKIHIGFVSLHFDWISNNFSHPYIYYVNSFEQPCFPALTISENDLKKTVSVKALNFRVFHQHFLFFSSD